MSTRAEPPYTWPVITWANWLCVIGLVAVGAALVDSGHAAAQPTGDAKAGREVYAANCAMCHGADATGMMRMHPALRGAVQRLTVEGVEVTIRNGRQTMPPMPSFDGRLSDEEISDVIGYLESLPSGPRNFGPETDRDRMMRDGGMMDRMMGRGWTGPLVAIVLFLLVPAVVGLVVALVVDQRGKQAPERGQPGRESPGEILDRRYAAGELSAEKYGQVRDDLEA